MLKASIGLDGPDVLSAVSVMLCGRIPRKVLCSLPVKMDVALKVFVSYQQVGDGQGDGWRSHNILGHLPSANALA